MVPYIVLYQHSSRNHVTSKWATSCKNVSLGIWRQQRPRSGCASAQSDLGLQCQLTELLDTSTECINGEQWPGSYFVHVCLC